MRKIKSLRTPQSTMFPTKSKINFDETHRSVPGVMKRSTIKQRKALGEATKM